MYELPWTPAPGRRKEHWVQEKELWNLISDLESVSRKAKGTFRGQRNRRTMVPVIEGELAERLRTLGQQERTGLLV